MSPGVRKDFSPYLYSVGRSEVFGLFDLPAHRGFPAFAHSFGSPVGCPRNIFIRGLEAVRRLRLFQNAVPRF